MIVTAKPVNKLSKQEIDYCIRHNMHHKGSMQSVFQMCRDGHYPRAIAIFCSDGTENLGWGLLFWSRYGVPKSLYVYVSRQYRRQGAGTAIMKRAAMYRGSIRVFPWNDTSEGFFNQFRYDDRFKIV